MTRLLKCVCCGQAGEVGGLPPVHLQTVCSGTDAPAIALSIASKALAAEGVHLQVRHEMSCEKEPFKQAYIARNFPGVPVFSDVVELAERAAAGKGQAGAAMATIDNLREKPMNKSGLVDKLSERKLQLQNEFETLRTKIEEDTANWN